MASTTTQTATDTEAKVLKNVQASYGDWRDDLIRDGYAIVKGAIPTDRADAYRARALDWLTSFGTALDLSDPSTWTNANMPVQSKINTFSAYCASHEAFMWDVRLEPGVIDAFALLWGTHELLVSFDALNITLPNRADRPALGAWPHVDQSPFRSGLCCAQGVVNLAPSGPADGGLTVLPGSHAHLPDFFATQTDPATWSKQDLFLMSDDHLAWFAARGCVPTKLCADPGDLLLWDSRTVHWGAEPGPQSTQIRTVVYAAYTPAAWAAEDQLREKARCFGKWGGTTHWPHDNIRFREVKARLENGEVDPRERESPRERPVLTESLLRLAGVRRYDGREVLAGEGEA